MKISKPLSDFLLHLLSLIKVALSRNKEPEIEPGMEPTADLDYQYEIVMADSASVAFIKKAMKNGYQGDGMPPTDRCRSADALLHNYVDNDESIHIGINLREQTVVVLPRDKW